MVYGEGLPPITCWDCGFEFHQGHGCLFVVSVVCCQVEVSATGRSLIQRSPTDCGVSVCVIHKLQKWDGPVAPQRDSVLKEKCVRSVSEMLITGERGKQWETRCPSAAPSTTVITAITLKNGIAIYTFYSQKKPRCLSITKKNMLIRRSEIIAIYSEIHVKCVSCSVGKRESFSRIRIPAHLLLKYTSLSSLCT